MVQRFSIANPFKSFPGKETSSTSGDSYATAASEVYTNSWNTEDEEADMTTLRAASINRSNQSATPTNPSLNESSDDLSFYSGREAITPDMDGDTMTLHSNPFADPEYGETIRNPSIMETNTDRQYPRAPSTAPSAASTIRPVRISSTPDITTSPKNPLRNSPVERHADALEQETHDVIINIDDPLVIVQDSPEEQGTSATEKGSHDITNRADTYHESPQNSSYSTHDDLEAQTSFGSQLRLPQPLGHQYRGSTNSLMTVFQVPVAICRTRSNTDENSLLVARHETLLQIARRNQELSSQGREHSEAESARQDIQKLTEPLEKDARFMGSMLGVVGGGISMLVWIAVVLSKVGTPAAGEIGNRMIWWGVLSLIPLLVGGLVASYVLYRRRALHTCSLLMPLAVVGATDRNRERRIQSVGHSAWGYSQQSLARSEHQGSSVFANRTGRTDTVTSLGSLSSFQQTNDPDFQVLYPHAPARTPYTPVDRNVRSYGFYAFPSSSHTREQSVNSSGSSKFSASQLLPPPRFQPPAHQTHTRPIHGILTNNSGTSSNTLNTVRTSTSTSRLGREKSKLRNVTHASNPSDNSIDAYLAGQPNPIAASQFSPLDNPQFQPHARSEPGTKVSDMKFGRAPELSPLDHLRSTLKQILPLSPSHRSNHLSMQMSAHQEKFAKIRSTLAGAKSSRTSTGDSERDNRMLFPTPASELVDEAAVEDAPPASKTSVMPKKENSIDLPSATSPSISTSKFQAEEEVEMANVNRRGGRLISKYTMGKSKGTEIPVPEFDLGLASPRSGADKLNLKAKATLNKAAETITYIQQGRGVSGAHVVGEGEGECDDPILKAKLAVEGRMLEHEVGRFESQRSGADVLKERARMGLVKVKGTIENIQQGRGLANVEFAVERGRGRPEGERGLVDLRRQMIEREIGRGGVERQRSGADMAAERMGEGLRKVKGVVSHPRDALGRGGDSSDGFEERKSTESERALNRGSLGSSGTDRSVPMLRSGPSDASSSIKSADFAMSPTPERFI